MRLISLDSILNYDKLLLDGKFFMVHVLFLKKKKKPKPWQFALNEFYKDLCLNLNYVVIEITDFFFIIVQVCNSLPEKSFYTQL